MQKVTRERRVILVNWKDREEDKFEVFSNLKNFCSHYPSYSYNTLNNYLSKRGVAFENEEVLVERKKVTGAYVAPVRKIEFVARKRLMKEINEEEEDTHYWQGKTVRERAAALTFIVFGGKVDSFRMDRTIVNKIRPSK